MILHQKYKFLALSIVLILTSAAFSAQARTYKWTDKDGKVHYTQTKPPEQKEQNFEELAITKNSRKGDPECCMSLRTVADKMINAQMKGATLNDLYSFYHPKLGKLKELANFVSDKYQGNIPVSEISRMSLDACLNGAFRYCASNTSGNGQAKSNASGSGFYVDNDGHLVTNAHVVNNCGTVRIMPGELDASIVVQDKAKDLALVKVEVESNSAGVIRGGDTQRGEEIVVAGFPYRGELSSGIHITSGNISSLTGAKDDPNVIQITAAVQPGNSGGPLLDRSGNIAGVVVSKINSLYFAKKYKDIPQNISFAIRPRLLREFLNEHKIVYETAELEAQKETTEISKIAEAIAVVVECRADTGG